MTVSYSPISQGSLSLPNCAFCHQSLVDGEENIGHNSSNSPNLQHLAHQSCVATALQNSGKCQCPNCSQDIDPSSVLSFKENMFCQLNQFTKNVVKNNLSLVTGGSLGAIYGIALSIICGGYATICSFQFSTINHMSMQNYSLATHVIYNLGQGFLMIAGLSKIEEMTRTFFIATKPLKLMKIGAFIGALSSAYMFRQSIPNLEILGIEEVRAYASKVSLGLILGSTLGGALQGAI